MRRIPFHPLVRRWFAETFAAPTPVQMEGWERIAAGGDTLIAAPTGSGKTLAAFLWAVNRLVEARRRTGALEDRIHVVYVSPLKALGNDIEKNLRQPLADICERSPRASGVQLPEIRVAVRTGDTPAHERAAAAASTPPHILITTPESLYILLTAERSRQALLARRDGDRRRDPRRRRRQARRAPGALARAPRRARRAAACSASACRRRRSRSKKSRACWSAPGA